MIGDFGDYAHSVGYSDAMSAAHDHVMRLEDELDRAQSKLANTLAMLRELEWHEQSGDEIPGTFCLRCSGQEKHRAHCDLANILNETGIGCSICGGIILADTEEWESPLCVKHWHEMRMRFEHK